MKTHLNARACVLLLVFVVLGVYYPAIFSPLNSVDDPGTITFLLNADSLSLREIFSPGGTYYRPILLLSFLVDKYVWGLQESFMHLENIVFHLLNVLLLFAVARKCTPPDEERSALLPLTVALLFALHPINTEAVNWISGRTDLLSCFFILLATLLMLRRKATLPMTVLAALCLLTACLAKETAIFFLPAALVLPFYRGAAGETRGSVRATLLANWPHLLVFSAAGAGFFLFRALASPKGDAGVARVFSHVSGSQSAGVSTTLLLPLKAAGFYLKKLFFPLPLNFGIVHVSDLYLPVGVCLCLLVAWLLTRRTLSAFFFIAAASVSGSALMIPLLFLTWTPLAERYMYIPSAFFVLGMVLAVEGWKLGARFRPLVNALVCAILVFFCYATANRTLLWQDNLALFRDTLAKSPGFVPAQNEIAGALYQRGDKAEAAAMLKSMQLPATLINRQHGLIAQATSLARDGDLAGAEALLNQALKDPGKYEIDISKRLLALYDMKVFGGTASRAQAYPVSVRLLSRLYALTADPFYQYRLGITYLAQHERGLARDSFQSAAAQAPPNAVYRLPSLKLAQKLSD